MYARFYSFDVSEQHAGCQICDKNQHFSPKNPSKFGWWLEKGHLLEKFKKCTWFWEFAEKILDFCWNSPIFVNFFNFFAENMMKILSSNYFCLSNPKKSRTSGFREATVPLRTLILVTANCPESKLLRLTQTFNDWDERIVLQRNESILFSLLLRSRFLFNFFVHFKLNSFIKFYTIENLCQTHVCEGVCVFSHVVWHNSILQACS